jgi:DNA-directed RNA polymerase specialized sigma24 family protein
MSQDDETMEVHRQLMGITGGDSSAAAWLFDTFSEDLFVRLRHRYGYPGGLDPDDLLQDAFLFYFQREAKVLRDFLERTPPSDQTRAALLRHLWDLACGIASNRRRSAALRSVEPIDEVRTTSSRPNAERRSIDRDVLLRMDECLRSGNRRVYLYYKLRYRDGLAPQEVADITGWSRKATYKLKQALNEAVEHCAELLGIER